MGIWDNIQNPWDNRSYRNFSGGENLKIGPEFIGDNEVINAINCIISSEAPLITRDGKTRLNPTSLGSGPILSILRYTKTNGTKFLLVQHGTSLYAPTWDGVSDITNFGAAIKTGLTAGLKLRGRIWKDVVILTNGEDTVFYFNGTSCTDIPSAPLSPKFVVYANRLWGWEGNALKFCELEDYTDWPALNIILIRDDDGDYITNLSPQPGGMVIFKQNSAWSMYGTNRQNINIPEAPISSRIGCISYDSLVDDGVVMGKDNLYTFNLTGMRPFKETHTPLIKNMTIAQRKNVHMVLHTVENRILVFLGDNQELTLVIHGEFNSAITTWRNINASCFELVDNADDEEILLIGDATNGIIYKNEGQNDDGTLIETRIKSHYNDYDINLDKIWRLFQLEIDVVDDIDPVRFYLGYDVDYSRFGGMMTQSYNKNLLDWGIDAWGTANWGSNYRIKEEMWMGDVRGSRISFEIVVYHRIKLSGWSTRLRPAGVLP